MVRRTAGPGPCWNGTKTDVVLVAAEAAALGRQHADDRDRHVADRGSYWPTAVAPVGEQVGRDGLADHRDVARGRCRPASVKKPPAAISSSGSAGRPARTPWTRVCQFWLPAMIWALPCDDRADRDDAADAALDRLGVRPASARCWCRRPPECRRPECCPARSSGRWCRGRRAAP